MEAYMATPARAQSPLPLEGDFAAGMRKDSSGFGVRGHFASGVRESAVPLSRHSGDFASGLRSRLQDVLVPGDFARGLRRADA
jgi:hypothetical protein